MTKFRYNSHIILLPWSILYTNLGDHVVEIEIWRAQVFKKQTVALREESFKRQFFYKL